MTGKNLLHTYSKYANEYIDMDFIDSINYDRRQGSIDKMKAKEQQLYAKYGESTFEGFRNKLQELFNPNDFAVLKRFEPEYIENQLKDITQQSDLYEQKVKFIFDFDKLKALKLTLRDEKEGKREFELTYNFKEVKQTLKDVVKKHNFDTEKETMKAADALIHQMLTADALTIKTSSTFSDVLNYEETYEVHAIPNFPWGVTKEIYENAKNMNNTTILKEIDKASKKIYHFVFEELGKGCSKEMKQAINNVWTKHFGTSTIEPARFFVGASKGSFISGVQGALGEFQSALLFEYLSVQGAEQALPDIKGNTKLMNTLSKEKARVDVEIFQSIGLQVKNFNILESKVGDLVNKTFKYDIETKVHPEKLSRSLPRESRDDFLGFLANYFFNATYRDQHITDLIALQQALGEWLGEVMNMAIKDSIEDSATFYVFSGRYLVPCSQILEIADKLELRDKIHITGPKNPLTDKEFHHSVKDKKSGEIIVPYKKYWTKEDSVWKYTAKNESGYQNLISSLISIRTNFNYFEEIEKYAIF